MNPTYEQDGVVLYLGDCREVMAMLPANSVDAMVTDPPYELTQDGKASPNRVLLEFMFPDNPNLNADSSCNDELSILIDKILCLSGIAILPTPSAPMPISAMTLNGDSVQRQVDVKDTSKLPVGVANAERCGKWDADDTEHLGDFTLKLTDSGTMLQAMDRVGCGFLSGRLGVGLRITPASIPSLFHGLGPVMGGDDDVWHHNRSLTNLISTLARATCPTVASLDLRDRSGESLSAIEALVLFGTCFLGGAKLVRTPTAARRLPAKCEPRLIRVVDDVTGRTLSFNLIVHPLSLASKGFMGKQWDGSKVAYDVSLWQQALRVLKPGGYLLSFGGTRTYHRMVCGIEDAGFEIRDQVQWLYGSGFPKSHNVSKAIDREAGAERKVVGVDLSRAARLVNQMSDYETDAGWSAGNRSADITEPATEDAKRWEGFGTALKPAHEPIVIARKPIEGTIANNVLTHGTGALNIDGCRVPTEDSTARPDGKCKHGNESHSPSLGSNWNSDSYMSGGSPLGRWPANVIHDGSEEVLANFPQTTSGKLVGKYSGGGGKGIYGKFGEADKDFEQNSGSAARFFYCAKPSKRERGVGNDHPTVKPQTLLQYLCRLVTPPGGTILDPFAGSGSTLLAARAEGFSIIGVEQDEHYCDIAVGRLGGKAEAA